MTKLIRSVACPNWQEWSARDEFNSSVFFAKIRDRIFEEQRIHTQFGPNERHIPK